MNDTKLLNEISLMFNLPAQINEQECKKILAEKINHLINHDFSFLVQLLYRLDINESKLKNLLHQNTETDAGILIADMVIERQAQKIKTREQFKNNNSTSDEEKW